MNPTRKIHAAATNAGYSILPEGESLPKKLVALLHARDVAKYGGHYLNDLVFYKGDPDKTNDWVIVFNDGGFYKVDAIYMIWHRYQEEGTLVGRARWTNKSLQEGLLEYFSTGEISRDPDYQT